jgi:hypothetical protein
MFTPYLGGLSVTPLTEEIVEPSESPRMTELMQLYRNH